MWVNWRLIGIWAASSVIGISAFVVAQAWERPPPPAQADALASVQFSSDPNRECAKAGMNIHVAGCGGKGWAILPNPCQWPNRTGDYGDLTCHELGRINGYAAR